MKQFVGLLFIGALSLITACAFKSKTPATNTYTPPVTMTAQEDQKRTMALLGITELRQGAEGTRKDAPNYYNSDESKANPYPTLPDPLVTNDGRKVTSADMWVKVRRPEIVELFDREVYGRVPKVMPKVKWEVVSTTADTVANIPVITKQLLGHVDNSSYPLITVDIQLSLTTPANAKGPVPVMMEFGFMMGGMGGAGRGGAGLGAGLGAGRGAATPQGAGAGAATQQGAGQGASTQQGAGQGATRGAAGAAPQAGGTAAPRAGQAAAQQPAARAGAGGGGGMMGSRGPSWQQQVLEKGWGYALISPGSIQADNGAGLTQGIIGLCNKGQPRKVDDWGALRAWAWGASRAIDYFETDKAVDAKKVCIEGVSRYGKASIVTMAYDQRFASALVASAGEGGTSLYRRNWGELLENVAASNEYHWMAGNFLKYAGPLHVYDLPIDAHMLVALCAPRPVFISISTIEAGDGWQDTRGTFMAGVGAGPVYRLLGKKDLGTTELPPTGTGLVSGEIAFREHTDGHTTGSNWGYFLTFIERYFK